MAQLRRGAAGRTGATVRWTPARQPVGQRCASVRAGRCGSAVKAGLAAGSGMAAPATECGERLHAARHWEDEMQTEPRRRSGLRWLPSVWLERADQAVYLIVAVLFLVAAIAM